MKKILNLLTAEQKKAYHDLLGEKFEGRFPFGPPARSAIPSMKKKLRMPVGVDSCGRTRYDEARIECDKAFLRPSDAGGCHDLPPLDPRICVLH